MVTFVLNWLWYNPTNVVQLDFTAKTVQSKLQMLYLALGATFAPSKVRPRAHVPQANTPSKIRMNVKIALRAISALGPISLMMAVMS